MPLFAHSAKSSRFRFLCHFGSLRLALERTRDGSAMEGKQGKSTSVNAMRFPLRFVTQQTTHITDSCTRRSRIASDPWGSLPPTKTRTSPTHYVQHACNNARSDERHLDGHPEGVFVRARLVAVRSRVLELPQCQRKARLLVTAVVELVGKHFHLSHHSNTQRQQRYASTADARFQK